jgi:excisionase family DNA binding protein
MFQQTEQQPITPLLLTPRQAAKLLSISERSLATYTKSGLIPVVRIGSSVRYSPDELRGWIRDHTERKSENSPELPLDNVSSAR